MKRLAVLLIPALLLISPMATAQGSIVAPSPNSRTSLDLYESPDTPNVAKQILVGEAVFPLSIIAAQSGFLQVRISGQAYWLKAAQVRVDRKVDASCTVAMGKTERIGATPGAGSNVCK